eukprot:SAG22_NODE_1066_length_5744_cov_7.937290_3_plen_233_part_00
MPYGETSAADMDVAQAAGLRVAFSLKDIFFGSSNCPAAIKSLAGEEAYFRQRVAAFRDHPALLAWYVNDEMGAGYRVRLLQHQRWLEQDDGAHPSWEVVDAQSLEELGYPVRGCICVRNVLCRPAPRTPIFGTPPAPVPACRLSDCCCMSRSYDIVLGRPATSAAPTRTRSVRTKALPFFGASTVFLSKTGPFRALPLNQASATRPGRRRRPGSGRRWPRPSGSPTGRGRSG